ncbi:SlyX family protein [Neiella sp. HB171785]|uniref:Protein SlyX homolog n=1 Tax=Neiella litorisoli TaxID=2771431 RepID=A0A8J6R1N3_9GAMM|nr:SlyX family protein [Neiella litorisoli]MBD1387970.1 SlyX family protein [Neiella litorisoli]
MVANDNALQTRIDELESKLAFQEITMNDLNQELSAHRELIDKLQVQVKLMFSQIHDLKGSNMASESEETPPPHY